MLQVIAAMSRASENLGSIWFVEFQSVSQSAHHSIQYMHVVIHACSFAAAVNTYVLVRSGRISNLFKMLWLSSFLKNEEDRIKNEGARVVTRFSPL